MEQPPLSKIERARRYMLKMPLAVSGCDGHGTTFHVACTLYNGFALTDDETLDLMYEYNERLDSDDQWNWKELAHKVRSAMNAPHKNPRGHLLGPQELPSSRPMVQPAPPAERITWKIRKREPQEPAAASDPANATGSGQEGLKCHPEAKEQAPATVEAPLAIEDQWAIVWSRSKDHYEAEPVWWMLQQNLEAHQTNTPTDFSTLGIYKSYEEAEEGFLRIKAQRCPLPEIATVD